MNEPVSSCPLEGSYTQCSISAWPIPCRMPPCSCPSSRTWLMTRPQSSTARDRKSTRLNSSHTVISYAVFCLKKKKKKNKKKEKRHQTKKRHNKHPVSI